MEKFYIFRFILSLSYIIIILIQLLHDQALILFKVSSFQKINEKFRNTSNMIQIVFPKITNPRTRCRISFRNRGWNNECQA